ncbi:uncharacterized protein LOC105687471 [Athalia rosae]|uniref:uncharacterized protein LOC105687471 n=1 Tax=Athalia rosae TaxID=37344 RepID=UPI0020341AE1|nr:uncharacterized protein LOC105687471 [Athalia rosae]
MSSSEDEVHRDIKPHIIDNTSASEDEYIIPDIAETMMSSSEDETDQCTPSDFVDETKHVLINTLPAKSRTRYESIYDKFVEWRKKKNTTSFSENVLMTYFNELSKTLKPSTLWSQYSMLKSTIISRDDIDISSYTNLTAFLKRQATGFKSKKSKVLTSHDVEEFLNKAPDMKYLATKVALVFGVAGACRGRELCNITTSDINDTGTMAVITIPQAETNVQRTFLVIQNFYDIFKKYKALRPPDAATNRFFLNYQNGKCTQQVIGIHKFGNMPKEIAAFLNLSNPKDYTGHSFRRTSATLLADTGVNIRRLTNHIGWKSNRAAEEHNDDSPDDRNESFKRITESGDMEPSTPIACNSSVVDSTLELPSSTKRIKHSNDVANIAKIVTPGTASLTFNRCSNITILQDSTSKNGSLTFNECSNITIDFREKK